MKKIFILLFAVAFVLFACKQAEKPAEQVKKVTLEEINSSIKAAKSKLKV